MSLAHDVAPATQQTSRGLKVLVVEDDEADAHLIQRVLHDHPSVGPVIRAIDGVAALELIKDGVAPDLAIIDLHMPRMNGFNLLVELGGASRSFPMVVLSSSKAPTDAVRCKLRGADQVLTKPNTFEEFGVMLDAAIAAV